MPRIAVIPRLKRDHNAAGWHALRERPHLRAVILHDVADVGAAGDDRPRDLVDPFNGKLTSADHIAEPAAPPMVVGVEPCGLVSFLLGTLLGVTADGVRLEALRPEFCKVRIRGSSQQLPLQQPISFCEIAVELCRADLLPHCSRYIVAIAIADDQSADNTEGLAKAKAQEGDGGTSGAGARQLIEHRVDLELGNSHASEQDQESAEFLHCIRDVCPLARVTYPAHLHVVRCRQWEGCAAVTAGSPTSLEQRLIAAGDRIANSYASKADEVVEVEVHQGWGALRPPNARRPHHWRE